MYSDSSRHTTNLCEQCDIIYALEKHSYLSLLCFRYFITFSTSARSNIEIAEHRAVLGEEKLNVITHSSIELHSQYGIGVTVIANLRALPEVADLKLSGGRRTDHRNEAAVKESLDDAHILGI